MHRDYSEDTAREIDEEVKKIISEAGERAETILKKKIKKLKILAETLLEKEILTGDEIEEIVGDGKKKRNRKKSN
jgi:ATP-dependent Zn protease